MYLELGQGLLHLLLLLCPVHNLTHLLLKLVQLQLQQIVQLELVIYHKFDLPVSDRSPSVTSEIVLMLGLCQDLPNAVQSKGNVACHQAGAERCLVSRSNH